MSEKIHRIKYVKILEILSQESDEDRPLTTPYIIEQLARHNIKVDRRTLYDDIRILNECGYEILCQRSRQNLYYMVDRKFDVPELRVLMDAVQSASFISENKTDELLDKIASLGGSYRAKLLKRNNIDFNIKKHINKQAMYSVNEIEEAITNNKKIKFKYFDLDYTGEKVFRKNGDYYEVNPIATVFDDDNYYLVSFSDKYQNYTNYRVDRMDGVVMQSTDRSDSELITKFNIHKYKKQTFGMYSGKKETLTLQFEKEMVEVVFDKFGHDTVIQPYKDDKYRAMVEVVISEQFFGALAGLGTKIQVLRPENIVEEYKAFLDKIREQYKEKINGTKN